MFKKNFIRLCNQKGVAPTVVCKEVGLSNATFSCWTDESVPRRATLMKIANYFGVTEEVLVADPADDQKPIPTTNPRLFALIDDLSPEDLAEMERYAEFLLSKREKS